MPTSRILPAALVAALLMLAAWPALPGSTAAAFTDRVETTIAFSAHTLPAPSGVVAALEGNAVAVSWQPGAGDVASHYEVHRREGTCDGWAPSGTPLVLVAAPTFSYTDASVQPGATYCYGVRGTFEQWVSPFAAGGPVTVPAPQPVSTQLYLQGPGTLQDTPGAGSDRFDNDQSRVYRSTTPVRIGTSGGWSASIALSGRGNPGAGITLTVDVWYVDAGSACGSSAPAGQQLGGGTISRTPSTSHLVFEPPFVVEMPLAGASDAPAAPQIICTRVHVEIGSGNPASRWYQVEYGMDSWIEGPVAP